MKKWMRFLMGIGAGTLLLGFVVSGIEKKKEQEKIIDVICRCFA